MKRKEVSILYQYIMLRNVLDKVVEDNEGIIELPDDRETDRIMAEAEKKVETGSGKTRDEIRYEYLYNVMKDTLAEILSINAGKQVKTPSEEELQQLHQQAVYELGGSAPESSLIAHALKF